MRGIALFKPSIGSMCQNTRCKKVSYRGDSIDYLVGGSSFCEEHARNACDAQQIPFPGEKAKALPSGQDTLVEFLKNNLKLVSRSIGGCPEENSPPDCNVYLVLDGEVISEVNLND